MLVRSWTVETVGERLRRRLSGSTRAESHDRHGRALDQSPAIFAALRRRLVGHRSVAAHRTASSHQPRRPCLGGATDGCPLAPSLRFRHLVSFDLPVGAWCCRSIGRSVHGGHGSPWGMSGSPTDPVTGVAERPSESLSLRLRIASSLQRPGVTRRPSGFSATSVVCISRHCRVACRENGAKRVRGVGGSVSNATRRKGL